MKRYSGKTCMVRVIFGIWLGGNAVLAIPQTGWMAFGVSSERMPTREVISDQAGMTVLEITIPGMQIEERTQQGIDYQQVSLPYGGTCSEVGKPALPLITELVAIPDQGEVTVKVLAIETTTITDVQIYPFLEPPLRNGQQSDAEFVLDKEVYQGRKLYPTEWVRCGNPVIWRDVRLAPVVIQPCRWNPETKELLVATRLRIEVQTSGTGGESVKERRPFVSGEDTRHHGVAISGRYAKMYQDRVINWNSNSEGMDLASEGQLLVITHPDFYNSILPFANWKHRKGFLTTVVSLDQISTHPTPSDIKDFIRNAYTTWDTPPEYVILVGDYNFVPMWNGLEDSKTDHPYSLLEGNDYLPDVVMARFSVETAQECDVLVTKLVNYEHNPYLIENGWYDAGTVIASDEGVDPENGLKVRQMLLDAEFSIVDLFQQPVSNQASNVVEALNDGRSWVFYIGHGNSTSWASTNPYFTNIHISSLTNDGKLPAIISIACENANLDYAGGDCFAETWMTTASNRGASNIMAFTENVAFYYSDTLGLGIMRSHFEDENPYFGNNVDFGRIYMYQSFPEGSGGTCERTMQQAILIGDPTQLVWSDVPRTMVVNHPSEIPVGTNQLSVNVYKDGMPLEDAMVCAMMESGNLYQVGLTNGAGIVSLPINLPAPGELELTVTHQNALPYETSIEVTPANGPNLIYTSYSLNDSSGNGNGLLDLGETVGVDVMLKNVGTSSATNVNVLLRSSNPHITLLDSGENYGTILPGDSLVVPGGFTLRAGTNLTTGEEIGIQVLVGADSSRAWTGFFSITGQAPEMQITGVEVLDFNGNGRLEPGETGQLIIAMQNNGSSTAPDVIGTLTANNPLVTVTSGPQILGQIQPGGDIQATYSLSVSSALPAGSLVSFQLALQASNGYVMPLLYSLYVGRLAAFLWEVDPTPISGQVVAAILDSMGLSYEMETTLPATLEQYASVWVFLGMWSHNHILTGTEGGRLAEYLDNGGSLYMEGGDTWVYDEQTAVHPYFRIVGVNDGWNDLSGIVGIQGMMTQGMVFGYHGENAFVDRIQPASGAELILHNAIPNYGCAVANDRGTYHTIGTSFELGGLTDGLAPSLKSNLVGHILDFFQVTEGEDQFPPIIQHTPLPDQTSEQGPYQVQAIVMDASGISDVTVHYSIDSRDSSTIIMTQASDSLYLAQIPGQMAGSVISYQIQATDGSVNANSVISPVYSFLILYPGSQVVFFTEDFETGNGGLISSGSDWQWGVPSPEEPGPSSGPSAAHSGSRVWATQLTGNYSPNSNSTIDTPPVDLRNTLHPYMSMWHWYSFEGSDGHLWDGGNVKVSVDGGPFQVLVPVQGYDGTMDNTANVLYGEGVFGTLDGGNNWHQTFFNLYQYAGHSVVIRFQIGSDGSTEAAGWYLDDILIQGVVFGPPPAVDDLTVTVINDDASLSWSRSDGAYEYRIYRSWDINFDSDQDSFLAVASFPHYLDRGVVRNHTKCFYRVIAVSQFGVAGPEFMMISRGSNP